MPSGGGFVIALVAFVDDDRSGVAAVKYVIYADERIHVPVCNRHLIARKKAYHGIPGCCCSVSRIGVNAA